MTTISLLFCAFCSSLEHEIVLQESKSEQKQFHILNLYKTRKSTNNWSPNFGLVEEIMDITCIIFDVPQIAAEPTKLGPILTQC